MGQDILSTLDERTIGPQGMKVDRMLFDRFADTVREDETVKNAVETGQWDQAVDYVHREVLNKPEEYYTLDTLRKAASVDRRISRRVILEKVFNLISRFKSRDELLEEEFDKFVAVHRPQQATSILAIKTYFKAYITGDLIRHVIDSRQFTDLATNAVFSLADYRAVPEEYRALVPEYVKDYVSLNQFAA